MKNLLKKTIKGVLGEKSKPYVYLYYKFYHKTSFPSMDHFVNEYSKVNPNTFFVQVGANEGSTEDPLYRQIRLKNWRGILIEPLKNEFEVLKNNYKDCNDLIFENVAISQKEELKPFYYVDNTQEGVPFWVTKLSSFDRSIPEQVLETVPEAKIKSFDVRCTTLEHLLEKNNVSKVDLLFIDTEGFDYEILKTVNFDKVVPSVVIYESRHLSDEDHASSIAMLKKLGYDIYRAEHDTVAFRDTPKMKELYRDHLD